MNNFIEIHDIPGPRSMIDFQTLVDPIKTIVMDYHWCITDLWSVRKRGADSSLNYLDEKILDNPNGLQLDWPKLQWILNQMHQVVYMKIVAGYEKETLKPYPTRVEAFQACDLFIESFEDVAGGFWFVYAKNKKIIEVLSESFKCCKTYNYPPDDILNAFF